MAACRLGLQSGADRLSCGAVLCMMPPPSAQEKLTAPEAAEAASSKQALHLYQGSARVQPSTAAALHCIPGVASPLLGHLAQQASSLPVGCWIPPMMPGA